MRTTRIARRLHPIDQRLDHDPRPLGDYPRAILRANKPGARVPGTMERFIADVERCLRSDHLPLEHAPVVVTGLEPVAEPGGGEAFGRARLRRQSNLEG